MDSYRPAPMSSGLDDLLGLGSDGLLGDVGGASSPPINPPQANIGGVFSAPPPAFVPSARAFPLAQVCCYFICLFHTADKFYLFKTK